MKKRSTCGADKAITKVQGEFERWRRERANRREPIPEELWNQSAVLCKQRSISMVAKALRLNATKLRKRVEKSLELLRASPEFIEFQMTSCEALQTEVEPPLLCVELSDSTGHRVTMRLSTFNTTDTVVSLANAFWSRSQ